MCAAFLSKICHWGPLTALGIIKIVTGMTIHCSGMIWPIASYGSILNTIGFMFFSGLTLYNFLSAIFHGPGFLPLNWQPQSKTDTKFLQYCTTCQGYKAPRSHHCQKCDRCVIKMDHHCPWINNCVGWGNQAHFTWFLASAVLGCMHATGLLSYTLYRAMFQNYYGYYAFPNSPRIYFTTLGLFTCVTALGLAIGVVIAVGMLLFFQLRGILRNRTGIEDWILDKAIRRRMNSQESFVYPYNLGAVKNWQQVCNLSCHPIGNGIHWDVADGCDQYTLTREQLLQKADKRKRTRLYHIVRPASGSWFPIYQGFKVCLSIPCSDEPRIKLQVDDKVLVTRWNKHWLFGEKLQKPNEKLEQPQKRIRGWFPRKCAMQMIDDTQVNSKSASMKKKSS